MASNQIEMTELNGPQMSFNFIYRDYIYQRDEENIEKVKILCFHFDKIRQNQFISTM